MLYMWFEAILIFLKKIVYPNITCKPMGNFAENLNLGKRNLPHSYKDDLKIILLDEIEGAVESTWFDQGGRTRLPKFKFSAKFRIGLHVILELQIKKFKTWLNQMRKIILTENPLGCNLAPLLK